MSFVASLGFLRIWVRVGRTAYCLQRARIVSVTSSVRTTLGYIPRRVKGAHL